MEKIDKPWGYELIWAKTDKYVGKKIFIFQGHRLSLQYHENKTESIYIIAGRMILEINDIDCNEENRKLIALKTGDSFHIPPKTVHRMIAEDDVFIIEVSTPELDDVVRLEDDYGRAEIKTSVDNDPFWEEN